MRKLLLATVAMLGGSIGAASLADAQTASPAPGTVTVRLNGRFRFYAFGDSISDFNTGASGSGTGAGTGTVNSSGQALTASGTVAGTNKLASYGFSDYARLYPGFDGVAANGLKYGASLEIRQDNNEMAGGGVGGSISASTRSRGELYLRREWGYIGTDQLGTIRLGATDGPSSLYMTGNFENFDGGGIDGDINFVIPGAATMTWPFADIGNMYATNKAVYLSPQLYGFDVGVAYEPSTTTVGNDGGTGGCGVSAFQGANFVTPAGAFVAASGANGTGAAAPGCEQLSSTNTNAESGRRKNTMDALLRYRGSFGGFGIAATAGYIGSSDVKDDQNGIAFNSNRALGTVRDNYAGLSVGDFGLAVTFGGLTVGGKYQYGAMNGQWALTSRGIPHGDSEAFLGGFSYTVGPLIFGAHYVHYQSAGDFGNAFFGRERTEQGVAAGATYSVAPGVSLFLSGVAQERKQNGYNFLTGQGVTAAAPGGNAYSNKVESRILALGTSFTW